MILVLQLEKDKAAAELVFDKEGLTLLKEIINKEWKEPKELRSDAYDLDHDHLSSKEWGGDELTPEFTSKGYREIHALKIVYLGEEG